MDEIFKTDLTLDKFGTINTDFILANDAPLEITTFVMDIHILTLKNMFQQLLK